jgi:hypothetical protein
MNSNHSDMFYGFSFIGSDSYSGGILNHKYGLPSLSISQDSVSDVLAIPGSDCNCSNRVPEMFDISKLTDDKFWQQRLGDRAIAQLSGVNLNGEVVNTAFYLDQPTFTRDGNISFQTNLIGDQNSFSPDLINYAVIHFSPLQEESDELINNQGLNIENNESFLSSRLSNLSVINSTRNSVNNISIVVPKDGFSDFVPLNLTSPSDSSKTISIESISDQSKWNNLFGRSMPSASLSWLDSEKQVQQLALTINRPTFNRMTNEYVISASTTDGNSIPDLKTISNASLFIDSPGKSNIPPYSMGSMDDQSKPQMPAIDNEKLEWAGGITGMFITFAATYAIKQWWLTKYMTHFKDLRDYLLDHFPESENEVKEFMSEFSQQWRSSVQYINNMPDVMGEWGDMDSVISLENFSQDASTFQFLVLDDIRDKFSLWGDWDAVTKFMSDSLNTAVKETYESEIYNRFGSNGLRWLRIYEEDFDITPEQILTDSDLYKRWSMVAKRMTPEFANNYLERQKYLREQMRDAGFSCGDMLTGCWDGDISEEFTEDPAGDIAGQMLEAGILDEAEEGGAEFIVMDILGILLFE